MSRSSVLEYARYHGLSTPHTDAHLSMYLRLLSYASLDETALPALALPSKDVVISQSKLQLNSRAAMDLADMIRCPDRVSSDKTLSNPFRFRELKLEQPLLFSDHEKDVRSFKRPLDLDRIIRELRACTDLRDSNTINEVSFSAECDRAATAATQRVQLLRLDTKDDALDILSQSTDNYAQGFDIDELYKTCLSRPEVGLPTADDYKLMGDQKKFPEPPVPFLTLTMPPDEIAVPSSAGDQWLPEPPSDQEVALDNLAGHLEQRPTESDQICTSDISNGSQTKIYELLTETTWTPENLNGHDLETELTHGSGSLVSIDASKLKLDMPLLQLSLPAPCGEEVSRARLDELINDFVEFPPSSDDSDEARREEKLQQELEGYQTSMNMAIKQEQLAVDPAVLRLAVPEMPKVSPGGSNSVSLIDMAEGNSIIPYRIDPREESHLNWISFPMKLIQPDLQEELQNGMDVERYVTTPEKVTASKDLLWKEAGLRFLDERSEDAEELVLDVDSLLPSNVEPPFAVDVISSPLQRLADDTVQTYEQPAVFEQDVAGTTARRSILHTRKCHAPTQDTCLEDPTESGSDISSPLRAGSRPTKRPRLDLQSGNATSVRKAAFARPGITPRAFSASDSLASFLDLRGKRFRMSPLSKYKVTAGHGLAARLSEVSQDAIESSQALLEAMSPRPLNSMHSKVGEDDTIDRSHALPLQAAREAVQDIQVPSTPEKSGTSTFLPTPAAIVDSRLIILDEALVRNRALMNLLDQHAAEPIRAIYRDLEGSVDLILNPTTAVILTNIQALKQKSLPGQLNINSGTLQHRVIAASTQYETIFILISPTSVAVDLPSDIINEFTAFCIGLKATATLIYPVWLPITTVTPGQKTTDPIMAWTWRLICQYSHKVIGEMSFIDDTTLWELFLREAGINALAAQLMLGMLKRDGASQNVLGVDTSMKGAEEAVSAATPDSWGLRRLVAMGEQERRDMFGELVGKKCLTRLSAVLDSTLTN